MVCPMQVGERWNSRLTPILPRIAQHGITDTARYNQLIRVCRTEGVIFVDIGESPCFRTRTDPLTGKF